MKLFPFLFILFYPAWGYLQSSTWNSQIEYWLEQPSSSNFKFISNRDSLSYSIHIGTFLSKLNAIQMQCANRNYCLTNRLIDDLQTGKRKAFSITWGVPLGKDSINFLISEKIINYDHNDTMWVKSLENIKSFLVHQEWKGLKTKVLGITPIYHTRDSIKKRIFFIPFDNKLKSSFSLNKKSIVWVKETIDIILPYALDSTMYQLDYFTRLIKQEYPVVVSNYGYYPFNTTQKRLSKEEVRQIIANLDSKISGVLLHQFWYYDLSNHSINTHLNAIAPVIDIKDENGKFKYHKPLFFILTNQ